MNYTKLSLVVLVGSYASMLSCDNVADKLRKAKERAVHATQKVNSKITEKSTMVGRRVSQEAESMAKKVKAGARETVADFKEAYQEVRETVAPKTVKKEKFLATIEQEQERMVARYILDAIEKSGALKHIEKASPSYAHLKNEQLELLMGFYFMSALSAFSAETFKLSSTDFEALCKRAAEYVHNYLQSEVIAG